MIKMLKTASEGETLSKGLAIGAAVISVLLAGCGTEGTTPESDSSSDAANSAPVPEKPTRAGPAKSLQVADKCSILTEQQRQSIGIDQAPSESLTDGKQGCMYRKGASGSDGGQTIFVAADPGTTMQQFADTRASQAKLTNIGGYPASQVKVGPLNCLLAVDVADNGSLSVSGQVNENADDPCGAANKAAEAAVQNLPNA